jgi:hypothetical protein
MDFSRPDVVLVSLVGFFFAEMAPVGLAVFCSRRTVEKAAATQKEN